MTALLEATGVVKRFGGLVAVDHVDLSVGPGEIVGLIGPNGSGKTTLFDCLSCVQRADDGEVRFDGTDITHRTPHHVARLGVARTFQIIRVYGALTVRENLELSASWTHIGLRRLLSRTDAATRRRADQLMDFLMLGPLADDRADTLSGGQRRLAEIGMALMSEPRLILLDEATSGVNPTLRGDIRDRLLSINAERGRGASARGAQHGVRRRALPASGGAGPRSQARRRHPHRSHEQPRSGRGLLRCRWRRRG